MINFTDSILALLLRLSVAGIDAYLFFSALRLVLGEMSGPHQTVFLPALSTVTDGFPARLTQWLSARRGRPTPGWVGWTIALVALLLVRNMAISFILNLSH